LWDEFEVWVSEDTISRWLTKRRFRKKRIRFVAEERDVFLRDDWMRRLSQWKHWQLVFVDESAANERTKDRKHGWAPIGVRPTERRPHKRSERWSILPAYTSRGGYIAYEIIQGAFTKEAFLNFLRDKVLPLCNRYDPDDPRENSVLVMDNASIHRGPEIRALCDEFGVRLEYLPPYSPDYNPIEESFAELKAWMQRNRELADTFGEDFVGFIELGVKMLVPKAGKHFASCCISMKD
jgi:hypothetical protein